MTIEIKSLHVKIFKSVRETKSVIGLNLNSYLFNNLISKGRHSTFKILESYFYLYSPYIVFRSVNKKSPKLLDDSI